MTKLEEAIQIAVKAHTSQKLDEDGMPHMVHVFEVMKIVKDEAERQLRGDIYYPAQYALEKYTLEELLIAAILHDTVEDSWENEAPLERVDLDRVEAVFGPKVRTLVDGVTRRKYLNGVLTYTVSEKTPGVTKETYKDFIYRAKADPGTLFIKSADLSHNRGRAFRIKQAKWRDKLMNKYSAAMRVLSTDPTDQPTWEQASAAWNHDEGYSLLDPNGKKILVTEEEFKRLTKKASA